MFSLPRSNVAPIRRRIDQFYTHLHQLYDIVEGKASNTTQANPHGLRIKETNELISGLKICYSTRVAQLNK